MTYTVTPPTAYPLPGNYDSPQIITLLSDFPGAEIHYTLDGSQPTDSSPVFDPYRLIPMLEFGQEMHEGNRKLAIRAISKVGNRISNSETFLYQIEPRSRDEYISQELFPWLRNIRDFDNDKMYLLLGSEKALLIDCGMGSGDLRGVVESFTSGLPLEVVITHAHPDHIARIGQFQSDCPVYMHHDDLPLLKRFIEHLHYEIDPTKILHVDEGFIFDLGNRRLKVFHIPGHSKGSIVLLDEENGVLFSGDAIGSNRPTIVDALWMQMSETHIDEYLSILQVFRSKTAGKIKRIYGGHNDQAFVGASYLDHLQEAAQRLVDLGIEALTPSPRPGGVWQSVSGDRLKDPNWAAINVNRDTCLSSPPEKIATLSNLQLKGADLRNEFKPGTFQYTAIPNPGLSEIVMTPTTTSRRFGKLTINDTVGSSGKSFLIHHSGIGNEPILINVTSPDQTTSNTYTVMLTET